MSPPRRPAASAHLVLAVALAVAACGGGTATPGSSGPGTGPTTPAAPAPIPGAPARPTGPTEDATLVRLVDGDTIRVIAGGVEERVRYIGIDTPELNASSPATPDPYAEAATNANARLLQLGRGEDPGRWCQRAPTTGPRANRGVTPWVHIRRMDVYRRLINRDLPWAERTCTSKAAFGTRREAASLAQHGKRSSGSLRPYHCPLADHWHLGHRKRRNPAFGSDQPSAPLPPCTSPAGSPGWLSREWWSTRSLRHFRPPRGDRSWREAWAPA